VLAGKQARPFCHKRLIFPAFPKRAVFLHVNNG